jgi:hypothetical protein
MDLKTRKLFEYGVFMCTLIVCLFTAIALHIILWMYFRPTATSIMTILVLLFTLITFLDRRSATRRMSVAGIALYFLSRIIEEEIGTAEGTWIYWASALVWSVALSRAHANVQIRLQTDE